MWIEVGKEYSCNSAKRLLAFPKLSLNVDKTCYSVFGPTYQKDMALTLHINGKAIQNVNSCKYLGIMIDNDLKWKTHIDYIYSKLIKFVSNFIRYELNYVTVLVKCDSTASGRCHQLSPSWSKEHQSWCLPSASSQLIAGHRAIRRSRRVYGHLSERRWSYPRQSTNAEF